MMKSLQFGTVLLTAVLPGTLADSAAGASASRCTTFSNTKPVVSLDPTRPTIVNTPRAEALETTRSEMHLCITKCAYPGGDSAVFRPEATTSAIVTKAQADAKPTGPATRSVSTLDSRAILPTGASECVTDCAFWEFEGPMTITVTGNHVLVNDAEITEQARDFSLPRLSPTWDPKGAFPTPFPMLSLPTTSRRPKPTDPFEAPMVTRSPPAPTLSAVPKDVNTTEQAIANEVGTAADTVADIVADRDPRIVLWCPTGRFHSEFSPELTGFCTFHSGMYCKKEGRPSHKFRSKHRRCHRCVCKRKP